VNTAIEADWTVITLPSVSGPAIPAVQALGNTALLDGPLLGLLASRECPGAVLIETLEQVPEWVRTGQVIVSGFHSPLEQLVLRSLLRRQGQAVKILARGRPTHRITGPERTALEAGRLLILTACPPGARRITRASALARNRLVLALARECVIPHAAPGSPLDELVGNPRAHADFGVERHPRMSTHHE